MNIDWKLEVGRVAVIAVVAVALMWLVTSMSAERHGDQLEAIHKIVIDTNSLVNAIAREVGKK